MGSGTGHEPEIGAGFEQSVEIANPSHHIRTRKWNKEFVVRSGCFREFGIESGRSSHDEFVQRFIPGIDQA